VPDLTPEQAGSNLARISGRADLTLYAHYATDAAGHRRDMRSALDSLARVDAFLKGIVRSLDADTLLVIASDHGNLEDVRSGHTRNPALGVAAGPGSDRASELDDIREVAPFLLELLGVRD
jgi:2,3-bisphosphoglycerate-independent phosphoglycerate mutase